MKKLMTSRISETLVPPVPHQWMGLFTALKSDRPLQHAETWIKEEMNACYGGHMSTQWQALLQFLADVVVVAVGCKELRLVSVHSYLPLVLQRNLLVLIYQHRADVSKEVLRHFIEKVKHCDDSLTWPSLLWKLLSRYVGISDAEKIPTILPVIKQESSPKYASEESSKVNKEEMEADIVPEPPGTIPGEVLEKNIIKEIKRDDQGDSDGEDCIIILDEDDERPAKKVKVEETAPEDTGGTSTCGEVYEVEQELIDKGTTLGELLQSSPEDGASVMEALKTFLQIPSVKLPALCRACGLDDLPETGLESVCGAMVKMADTISHSSCVALISGVVTHKLESLDHTASRLLQGVVMSLAETFPLQLVDAVLVPSLVHRLGAPQSEILCRLCKDCLSKSHQAHMIRKLVEGATILTEPALAVLNSILEAKPDLDDGHTTAILDCLSRSAEDFKNNLKFGKLLLSFVNKYAKQLTRMHISTMSQISGSHKTFLRTKIDASLKKVFS